MEILSNLDLDKVPKSPGVYIVYWMRNNAPVSIPRVLSVCGKGVLYIGASETNLRRRLKDLRTSIEVAKGVRRRKRYPHTFGSSLVYTRLIDLIKDSEIYVYFKTFDSGDAADIQEKLALLHHTRKYGEPPPLNLQIARRYLAIVGAAEPGKSRVAGSLDPDLRDAIGL